METTSNKGREKMCVNGYMYTRHSTTNNYRHWRCTKRGSGCKGRLRTPVDTLEDPVSVNVHNHQPNEIEVQVTVARVSMKRRATETRDKPSNIYQGVLQELDGMTRAFLPQEATCKRTIRNQRIADCHLNQQE
ncbi:uncharacterized protein pre-mod(mdg4)-O [Palaemon carinicauda]|uniref:uncharacterized protein pre-mod(mdg4)-O n=1 Tax=Palaemon carinicauda TaxID=392227 RepID=UPI0035B674F9